MRRGIIFLIMACAVYTIDTGAWHVRWISPTARSFQPVYVLISIMVLQFVLILLLAGPLQTAFPHPIGEPNVKIESLGNAHVSPQEKHAIIATVFPTGTPGQCIARERTAEQELDAIRVAHASLAAGEHNVLIQASDHCHCGGTGNCTLWILSAKPAGFDTLLKAIGVQSYSLEPSSSHGYRDILTYSHGSATSGDLRLYQFDGKRYRKTRCAEQVYPEREDGSTSDKPTITATQCNK
jgi:hypothetical protein